MGFFSNQNIRFNSRKTSLTTNGFYIGTPEAEGENRSNEQNLVSFYEDYNDINQNIKEGKFIISGRKGTGKSAYVKYISDNSSEENSMYSSLIRPSDLNLETSIQNIPEDFGHRYEMIFEWVILIRFVAMILSTKEGYATKEVRALQSFQEKNRGLVDIDKFMTLERLNSGNIELNITPLKGTFGTTLNKTFNNKTVRAAFYILIPSLREIVCKILTFQCLETIDFFVMFDDLDVNFKLTNYEHKTKLMDLIRIAKKYNCEYLRNTKARVLVFIRDDIGKRLGGIDSDKNKIFGSYEYCINWYNHNDAKVDETNILLRQFINKRIGINFELWNIPYDKKDPWATFVNNTPCEAYNNKSAFKYLLDFTFYRPRDLINIFNNIGNENFPIPLSPESIKALLRKYVRSNAEEIKDELTALFEPDMIESIFGVLKDISRTNAGASYQQVLDFMDNHSIEHKFFNTFIDYSLFCAKDRVGSRFYHVYREQYIQDNYEDYDYVLPKALYIYFCPERLN